MNFNDYQKAAVKTDMTAGKGKGVLSIQFMDKVLGLLGESGEFAEKLKKILRDQDAMLNSEDRKALAKELGDVLWYLAVIANYLETPLDDIASSNLEKLKSRKARGQLGGSGDNR